MMQIDDFIMLGRTEPQQTKNHGVTVCSAGYSQTLNQLIRIYPIPMSVNIPRFSLCCVNLERGQDSRQESFKLCSGDSIKVERKLSKIEMQGLKKKLYQMRSPSINSLNKDRKSLGIISPLTISGDWKSKKQLKNLGVQLEIDIANNGNPLFNMPDVPLLKIVNEDGSLNNLQLRDWGCSEFIRKFVVSQKYKKDDLWDALHFDQSQIVLVGNMRFFPSRWLAIATIVYPFAAQSLYTQKTLF